MKLTFTFAGPVRLDFALGLALVLMILQLATGTSLLFAELTFVAVVSSVLSVNCAGGLKTLAGCCFAVVALKVFIVAEVAKVWFGEPGQSRLEEPNTTMGVLALSMVALWIGSLVCLPFRPRKVVLPRTLDPELLRIMTILSFVVGTMSGFVAQFLGVTEDGAVAIGGLSGMLRRISACAPLAIVAGTAYTIITSDGRRIFSVYNAVPFLAEFAIGILSTSKQAIFDPFFYLVITGMAFRFPWQRSHLVAGMLSAFLAVFVLFPFGQVARNYTRGPTIRETYRKTVEWLGENIKRPRFFLEQYEQYKEAAADEAMGRYFNQPNGFLERMALIKPADMLITTTLREGQSGWSSIVSGLKDLVPRIFLPRRYVNVPNELGYKAGVIDENNFGTSVSFGFAADAFSSFGWQGVGLSSFAIGILVIVITRLLVGPFERNIWPLVLLGAYQVGIAEANVGGVLQAIIYQTGWILSCCFGIRVSAQFLLLSRRSLKPKKDRLVVARSAEPNVGGA
jgi:hypothetical protein